MEEPVGPRVTVTIPTRNRAPLLRETIDSVLNQSFGAFEVIVSDNASTDETPDVVRSIDDPRVRLDRLEEDTGRYGNLTRCLHLGSAPYVTILHDDDLMLPGNLEHKVSFMDRHPSAGFVYSAGLGIDAEGRPIQGLENRDEWPDEHLEPGASFIRRTMRHGVIPSTPTLFFRRDAVAGEEFAEADGPHCDSALCLRLARHHDVGYVPQVLAAFRFHPDSMSGAADGIARYRRGNRPRTTKAYVASVEHAHERFLAIHCPDSEDQAELRSLLASHLRRQRLRVAVRSVLPTPVVDVLKHALRR
jgi:glycosyltransferase involved in cell wall biosynthesis